VKQNVKPINRLGRTVSCAQSLTFFNPRRFDDAPQHDVNTFPQVGRVIELNCCSSELHMWSHASREIQGASMRGTFIDKKFCVATNEIVSAGTQDQRAQDQRGANQKSMWRVTVIKSPGTLGQTMNVPAGTSIRGLRTMVLGDMDDPRKLFFHDKDDDPVLLEETEDVEDWLELADRDTNNEGRLRKKAKLFVLDNADGTVPARSTPARSAMPAPTTAVASAAAPPAAAAAAAAAAVTGAGSAAAAPAFGPGQGHRIRLLGMLPRGTPLVPGGLNGQLSLSELKDQIYRALLNGELSVDYFQDRAGHVAADGTIVLGKGGIVAAWSAPALRSKLISLIQFVEAARSNPSVRPQ
jgi:hypothetical protein